MTQLVIYTLTVMDWFQQNAEEHFRQIRVGAGVYPELPLYTLPSDLTSLGPFYRLTVGPDFADVGTNLFWSALFHGKGRRNSVPYERSSLNIYEVEQGQMYRFRLIHTGIMYAFRFSIDGHKLKAMATDGYLVDPVEVDYIAIHSGERYDFLLEANQGSGDFWIKAETFELDFENSVSPPFNFLNHKAEAILHYSGTEKPTPTEYGNISSDPIQCTEENPCKMLNCPFKQFHPAYNIECVSIDTLRLHVLTPPSEMPDNTPDITHFMNLGGFNGRRNPISSINDKNVRLPLYPLTTRYEENDENSFCDVNSECERQGGCECTTVMEVGYNVTVRLVISTVGAGKKEFDSFNSHSRTFCACLESRVWRIQQ